MIEINVIFANYIRVNVFRLAARSYINNALYFLILLTKWDEKINFIVKK